jgi:hypothetical protein
MNFSRITINPYQKGCLVSDRCVTPLPQLTDEVATLAARVEKHLKKMGFEQ